jgi:hypothetical protein
LENVSDLLIRHQEDKMAKLKGVVRLENVIRFSQSISEDGQVASILFENLLVSVGGKGSTLVATQVASFTLPTIDNGADFPVGLIIRGFVQTQPGARARLVASLGDTAVVVPLPQPPPSGEGEDYEQQVEATLPAGVDVQMTLFLLAERNSGDESLGVLLTVDTVDITLGKLDSGAA